MRRKQTGGAPEGARRASEGAPQAARGGRFSVQRKADAVQRLLRGEDLDAVSRALGVTAATLSAWRDDFLRGGASALKTQEAILEQDAAAELRGQVSASLGCESST